MTTDQPPSRLAHWKAALPFYLKMSLVRSASIWVPILAIGILTTLWLAFVQHRHIINWFFVKYAVAFGGFFFLLELLASVVNDIRKN